MPLKMALPSPSTQLAIVSCQESINHEAWLMSCW